MPPIPNTPALHALQAEYEALCHAMQTGVSYLMHYDGAETEPKHLRVGVNASFCTNAALAELLIEKGLITWEELLRSEITVMKREVESYQNLLKKHMGVDITLS